jgi:hypothetical protein
LMYSIIHSLFIYLQFVIRSKIVGHRLLSVSVFRVLLLVALQIHCDLP